MSMQTKNDAVAKMDELIKIIESMKGLVQNTGRVPGCKDLYHQEMQKIIITVAGIAEDISKHETKLVGLCLPWVEESHALNYAPSSSEGEEIVKRYSWLAQQRDTRFVHDVIKMIGS